MQQVPTVIIIGAGPGGLALYHSLIKNRDKKEFNVKIFERESGPKGKLYKYFSFNIYCHVTNFGVKKN
jgi:cation diffusion facilitator CzcD-associated flavoprotein CzcO